MTPQFEVIVFDLDDTLYLERDFAHSGFRAAGDWMKATTGIDSFAEKCAEIFASGRRASIFDTALDDFGLGKRPDILAQLIELYRRHVPSIVLAPDAERYLRSVRDRRRAIVTDGLAATQTAKIKALSVEALVDLVIVTDAWGREFWKPHERAFEAVEVWAQVDPARIVYVADNPIKDFVAPRRRGWRTIRIARPERVHLLDAIDPTHEPHATIQSFDQLEESLTTLLEQRESKPTPQ